MHAFNAYYVKLMLIFFDFKFRCTIGDKCKILYHLMYTVLQFALSFLYRNNIVRGAGLTADTTTPVQSSAVNFTLTNNSVSEFPMLM